MTAPTPERRVGEERPRVEAERVAHLAGMSDETVAGNFPAGGTMRALSRDLLDARTALIEVSGALHTEHQRVLSHAAEVERLRGVASAALAVKESGLRLPVALLDTPAKAEAWLSFGKTLAALSLPTHAPGATE